MIITQLHEEISENETKIKLKDAELDKLKTEQKGLISRLSGSKREASSSLVSYTAYCYLHNAINVIVLHAL